MATPKKKTAPARKPAPVPKKKTAPKAKAPARKAAPKKPAAKRGTKTKLAHTVTVTDKAVYQRNPIGREREAAQAVALYEKFTGMTADSFRRLELPDLKALVEIGIVEKIAYRTVRDGETGRYLHSFQRGQEPTLAITPDGRCALILEGIFEFTERGFVG